MYEVVKIVNKSDEPAALDFKKRIIKRRWISKSRRI
jgi:hypothetical protein